MKFFSLVIFIIIFTSCNNFTDCGSNNPNSSSQEVDHRKVVLEQDSLKIIVFQDIYFSSPGSIKVTTNPISNLKDTLRTTFFLNSYQESSKVDSIIQNNYIAQIQGDTLFLSYANYHYSQDSNSLETLNKTACLNNNSNRMARPSSLACDVRGPEIIIDSVYIDYDPSMNYEFLN